MNKVLLNGVLKRLNKRYDNDDGDEDEDEDGDGDEDEDEDFEVADES